jgi:hypothetical protein
MVNPIFIQTFLNCNPTIGQINQQAIALDDRAQYHLAVAKKAQSENYAAICVRHSHIALQMMDTADALRAIVAEAAHYLYIPNGEAPDLFPAELTRLAA